MAPQSNHISAGTVDTLKKLLEDAQKGQLIGVAFVGVMRGRRVTKGWSGYAGQDPHFALGALRQLDHELIMYAKREHQ
ncbi:hypothetical protein Nhal_0970 [Nitrosococcus halophilus Nc 4]|uniref:Uncharacterized protein n=1 Tax=Nitrosococcus halophilus (strain Nc4) TaxID=472759 RepID=D5BYG0_NITHN|nr:hypothetical protein Nhal_0970 [Nitrosococcus halophilus Nc 4]